VHSTVIFRRLADTGGSQEVWIGGFTEAEDFT
jgi:hypothetical protein